MRAGSLTLPEAALPSPTPPDTHAAKHLTRLTSLSSHPAFIPCVWNFVSYSVWTMYNKHIFNEFGSFPLLSTGLQMIMVTLCVHILLLVRNEPHQKASRAVLTGQLIPLSIVRSCDLGLANAALCLMSLAGQQILKATIPVWVCVLSILYLKKTVEPHVWGIVSIIVIGTAMATVGDPTMRGTPFGVAAMLVSCLCRAGKCVINTRLLQGLPGAAQQKMSKLSLLRYEAPMSGVTILIASFVFEFVGVWVSGGGEGGSEGAGWTVSSLAFFIGATLVNGVLMFVNQLTYLAVVEHTSPVASQALMNIKMIFLILVSSLFFPLHLSPLNAVGMAIASGGAVLYSVLGETRRAPHKNIQI